MGQGGREHDEKHGQKHDDDYFADQWGEMEDRERERDEAWRRKWLEWHRRNEGAAVYSPWLVVPASLDDYGLRPLAAGTVFWASPFIGVISPDPSGLPRAGAPNQIVARVFNLGAAMAAPAMIRFYWADPSLGFGALDVHTVGEIMVEVPPLSSTLVTCPTPWVPSFLNNGHECLFVSADNPQLDPIQAPFQPWADRHVGQRNVNVLPAVAQAMKLWLPDDELSLGREIRILALRVTAPRDMTMRKTAVETIAQVVDQVLAGFAAGRGKFETQRQGFPLSVRRIDADAVIAGQRLLEDTREGRGEDRLRARQWAESPAAFGETLLRVEARPKLAQLLELQLKPLDLPQNEFAILHITCLAGGHVEGGYVTTLANPSWFRPGRTHFPETTGGYMNTYGDSGGGSQGYDDLRDLVIRHNVQAQAVLEIAEQLAPQLPLESTRQLCDGVKLAGRHLPKELIDQLTEGMFPIRDSEDLVRKVTAMIRLFVAHGAAHRPTLSEGAAVLFDHLSSANGRPPIQVLVGGGRPLIPVPEQSKEC